MRYEVLTLTICDGWANTWLEDGEPETFESIAAAELALAEHMADLQEAVDSGDMSDAPDREDYQILPC